MLSFSKYFLVQYNDFIVGRFLYLQFDHVRRLSLGSRSRLCAVESPERFVASPLHVISLRLFDHVNR